MATKSQNSTEQRGAAPQEKSQSGKDSGKKGDAKAVAPTKIPAGGKAKAKSSK